MTLDIVGIAEIAEIMGKETGYVGVLHQRGKLPPHDGTINDGRTKVWRRSTIERWNTRRNETA